MELFHGRPASPDRSAREMRCYDLLDSLGIDYLRADHPPATTMEICSDIDSVLGTHICKNLFLCNRQQTVFYLLMMPGDKPFKTKELSAQLGVSRLSFAGPEHLERLLDLQPGSISVLGLMNDREKQVNLLIDEDVLQGEYFGCHPCENTSSLKLKICDLTEKILPATGHSATTVHLEGLE